MRWWCSIVYKSKYNSIGRTYFSQYLQIGSRRPGGALKICGLVVLQVPRVVVSLIGTDALDHLLIRYIQWIYPDLFYPRHHLLSFYNNIIVTKSMMVLMHSDTSYRQYYSRLFTITFIISYRNYPNFISSTSEA